MAYYMVLVTAVIQVIPNQAYKKYVRFFTGMVLVLLLVNPIWSIFGMEQHFMEIYDGQAYEQTTREMKDAADFQEKLKQAGAQAEYFWEKETEETNTNNGQGKSIEIGEVQIGR